MGAPDVGHRAITRSAFEPGGEKARRGGSISIHDQPAHARMTGQAARETCIPHRGRAKVRGCAPEPGGMETGSPSLALSDVTCGRTWRQTWRSCGTPLPGPWRSLPRQEYGVVDEQLRERPAPRVKAGIPCLFLYATFAPRRVSYMSGDGPGSPRQAGMPGLYPPARLTPPHCLPIGESGRRTSWHRQRLACARHRQAGWPDPTFWHDGRATR